MNRFTLAEIDLRDWRGAGLGDPQLSMLAVQRGRYVAVELDPSSEVTACQVCFDADRNRTVRLEMGHRFVEPFGQLAVGPDLPAPISAAIAAPVGATQTEENGLNPVAATAGQLGGKIRLRLHSTIPPVGSLPCRWLHARRRFNLTAGAGAAVTFDLGSMLTDGLDKARVKVTITGPATGLLTSRAFAGNRSSMLLRIGAASYEVLPFITGIDAASPTILAAALPESSDIVRFDCFYAGGAGASYAVEILISGMVRT